MGESLSDAVPHKSGAVSGKNSLPDDTDLARLIDRLKERWPALVEGERRRLIDAVEGVTVR